MSSALTLLFKMALYFNEMLLLYKLYTEIHLGNTEVVDYRSVFFQDCIAKVVGMTKSLHTCGSI